MSAAIHPIHGFMVRGNDVRFATISWSEPVDEPPTVRIEGGKPLYLSVWQKRGWEWRDLPVAAEMPSAN